MSETHWACLSCPAHGTTPGTETGPDAKHVRETGHAVTTGSEAVCARLGAGT